MRNLRSLLVVLLIGLVGLVTYFTAYRTYEASAIARSEQRLSLYRTALQSELERLSHMPLAMALHPDATETVLGIKPASSFNAYLEKVAKAAEGSVLYILDREGTTIASSNHNSDSSFVGKNYKFRPYFKQVMDGKEGQFFAVGVTTNIPGYFVSTAIQDKGENVGVAVVKTEFQKMVSVWQEAGEDVLITDRNGIIILSSQPDLAYKTTETLSKEVLANLAETKKLGKNTPTNLATVLPGLNTSEKTTLNGNQYLVRSKPVGIRDWNIHYMNGLSGVTRSSLLMSLAAGLLFSLIAIATLFARLRREETRLRAEAADAEQIKVMNQKLRKEISTRKKTENQLRETQVELIQSSRLAALGQMSAAIVHEVNQPVTAIRTFTSSGLLLMKKGQLDKAKGVLEDIKHMTERLGAITSDLLIFSRKPVSDPSAVDLNQCVSSIVRQFQPELEEAKIELSHTLSKSSTLAKGSEVRFEQLVANLLKNALQAVMQVEGDRKIRIETVHTENKLLLSVFDNGPGVPDEYKEQLFDPFFTTKPVGKGVGLGLALSYAIADEADGKISVSNNEDGGACFTVELPALATSPNAKKKRTVKA